MSLAARSRPVARWFRASPTEWTYYTRVRRTAHIQLAPTPSRSFTESRKRQWPTEPSRLRQFFSPRGHPSKSDVPILQEWLEAVEAADIESLHQLLARFALEIKDTGPENSRGTRLAIASAIYAIIHAEPSHAISAVDALLLAQLLGLDAELGHTAWDPDTASDIFNYLLRGCQDRSFSGNAVSDEALDFYFRESWQPTMTECEGLVNQLLRSDYFSEDASLVVALLSRTSDRLAYPVRERVLQSLGFWSARQSEAAERLLNIPTSLLQTATTDDLDKALLNLPRQYLHFKTAGDIASELESRGASSSASLVRHSLACRTAPSSEGLRSVADDIFIEHVTDSLSRSRDDSGSSTYVTDTLNSIEELFDRDAPLEVWTQCSLALLQMDGSSSSVDPSQEQISPARLAEAILFLEEGARKGVEIPTEAWGLVIRAYRDSFVPDLDAACRIYDRLRRASTVKLSRRRGYDIALNVVRMCYNVGDLTRAIEVLRSMQDSNEIVLLEHLQPLLLDLLSRVETEREVITVVNCFIQAVSNDTLSDHAADWPIQLLTRVLPLVSADGLFEVFQTMQRRARLPSTHEYSRLLKVMFQECRFSSPPEVKRRLGSKVAALHQILRADVHLEPDIGLLNTLMMAHGKAGSTTEAIEIWRSLKASKASVDGATMAIVFDICGWYRFYNEARSAYEWARARDSQRPRGTPKILNPNAMISWHEFLCRSRRLKQSVELAWQRMGPGGEIERDEEAQFNLLRLLLKFAANERDSPGSPEDVKQLWSALRARTRQEKPHLWSRLQTTGTHVKAEKKIVHSA